MTKARGEAPKPSSEPLTVPVVQAAVEPTMVPARLPTAIPKAVTINVAANKKQLMIAAGIASSDFAHVDYIITHESGWQPTIWNRGGSGSYGLGQALPATKMAAFGADYMTSGITQLRWANAYAKARYTTWAKAQQYWERNLWW